MDGRSRSLSNFLLYCICVLWLFNSFIEGAVRFTKVPPDVLYVSNRTTARLIWKYSVNNRTTELSEPAITWDFYARRNSTGIRLANENNLDKNWTIAGTCPPHLRTRISRGAAATLVIANVTSSDDGIYGCGMVLKEGSPIVSKVQLVVTDRPQFAVRPPLFKTILEGRDLAVQCSAIGPPRPNVKWTLQTDQGGVFKSEGLSSTTLSISNIRREKAGVYQCTATNNPNETPIKTTMRVTVEYRPVLDAARSSQNVFSWDNHTEYLNCMASGNPTPEVTWFRPDGEQVITGSMIVPGGGILALETKTAKDYGRYRCYVRNPWGSDGYFITVKRLNPPGAPVLTITDSDIEVQSVTVRWRGPIADDGGSVVISYKVELGTKPPREGITGNSVVISGLKKDTEYLVKVSARNKAGYGNATMGIVRTKKEDPVIVETSCTTAVAVCVPIIIVLLIVIMLLVLYHWQEKRRTKSLLFSVKKYAMESYSASERQVEPDQIEVITLDNHDNKPSTTPKQNDPTVIPNKNYRYNNGQPKSGHRRRGRRPLDILTSIEEENSGASGEMLNGHADPIEGLANSVNEDHVIENKDIMDEDDRGNDTKMEHLNGKTVVSVDVHDVESAA